MYSDRKRFIGPLDSDEVRFCRTKGIPLAYDTVQLGWVSLDVEDDIDNYEEAIAMSSPGNGPKRPVAARNDTMSQSLRFRRWREEDLSDYQRLLGNPRIWDLLPDARPDPFTEDIAQSLIAISNEEGHHEVRAVESDGQVVGQVRLLFDMTALDHSEAEISYWLGEAHWGRGIGSLAVARFTERAFKHWPSLTTIFARVHVNNKASARLLEKCGYRRERADAGDQDWIVFRISR